jgi:hypothetical protein
MTTFLNFISQVVAQFYKWAADMLAYITGWFLGFVFTLISWVFTAFDALLRKLASKVLDGFAAALEFIPVPESLSGLQAAWDAVPWSTVAYFAEPLHIGYGLGIVTAAALLKFSLRILPIVGVPFRSPS